ncbi:MAG: putative 2OG-Fe(II) oxygenase [Parerythrobacter sp.]
MTVRADSSPAACRNAAVAALNKAQVAHAARLLRDGMARWPDDATFQNSAGNLLLKAGDPAGATLAFGRAAGLVPASLEYALNEAIAANAAGEPHRALEVLARHEAAGQTSAPYCSTRALAARSIGDKTQAALWYDRALALDPKRPKALHGRARVALERGEDDALARFDAALAVNSGDGDLWLGRAQALDEAGCPQEARDLMQQIVAQAPHWLEGLRFLAQLRLAAGETDYADHYADACARVPQDPNLPTAYAGLLAANRDNAAAADVAAQAARRFGDTDHFTMLEAVYAGGAGETARAAALLERLDMTAPDRALHLARHYLRTGDPEHAETILAPLTEGETDQVEAWALRGLVWRLLDNPRAAWLHEQDGLVRQMPLHDASSVLPPAIARLHALHDRAAFPLGQSLRGGTQTRGLLFDRTEPEFMALRAAILATIEEYRAALPPADQAHPLLRHRDAPLGLAGSWSVRLSGGGDHHAAHIHPQGLLSSALYCERPDAARDTEKREGWLELGRPPPDLKLALEPVAAFPPTPGTLALFPSTLYHGTRPFTEGGRLTVAFDVARGHNAA